jgi:hypothetical protein
MITWDAVHWKDGIRSFETEKQRNHFIAHESKYNRLWAKGETLTGRDLIKDLQR